MSTDDRRRLGWLLAGAIFFGLLLWAVPDIKAWWKLATREPVAVQTSRHAGCPAPQEGEQLLIQVIPLDKQRLGLRCNYVTSRGQYRQSANASRL